uniref:5'-nucleotidase n=1 Tax=Oncorhynchus mykiss TaxID=8022 RepID=A0A8K9WSC4_ONCMY
MIPELSSLSVCMRDPQRVEEIIKAMQKAGTSTIQVISDFDMTLTRFAYNGKRCPPSHNILNNSRLISEECKAQLKDLLNTYYPIEIDSKWTVEEKLPLMVDWWTKAHTGDVVKESDAMLRELYQLFFDHLQEHSIPLLIFSAGLGDVLEEVIRLLKAFKGELIHIYNKREGALLNTGHFQELKSRHNVLLVGDSLGDLTMADGVHSIEDILKIGFLNDKVEERKTSYLNAYDIVLVKDETMEVPNALLLCFGVALPRSYS